MPTLCSDCVNCEVRCVINFANAKGVRGSIEWFSGLGGRAVVLPRHHDLVIVIYPAATFLCNIDSFVIEKNI